MADGKMQPPHPGEHGRLFRWGDTSGMVLRVVAV